MPNKITLPASRTVKIYYVKPDKKTEFLDFCGVGGKDANGKPVFKDNGEPFKGIRDWLLNEDHAENANFWTVDMFGLFMVVVALKSDDKGWDRIPGLDSYLQVRPDVVPLVELIDLSIP